MPDNANGKKQEKRGKGDTMKIRALACSMIFLFLTGCPSASSYLDLTQAEKNVDTFHAQLNEMNFRGMYNDFQEDVKKSIPEDRFISAFGEFTKSFGKYKSGKIIHSNVTFNVIGPNRVTLVYQSEYTIKPVVEEFTFERTRDGKLLIYRYEYKT